MISNNYQIELKLPLHSKQREIYDSKHRFIIVAKGRRFGFTHSLACNAVQTLCESQHPVLWVDTSYTNIEKYFERYFKPLLRQFHHRYWKFNKNSHTLKLLGRTLDFRSAENPENIEGFGYGKVLINEAGIVLKNSALWHETVFPTLLDYGGRAIIGGTPKGKMNAKEGTNSLFYDLFVQGQDDPLFKSFRFSSYDNPKINPADIDILAGQIPERLRNQEIFAEFVETDETEILKRQWWKFYTQRPASGYILQSWDTAFKKGENNDFSVCTTWLIDGGKIYLIGYYKGKLSYPELESKSIALAERFNPNLILIEDKASGQSLVQSLKKNTRLPIRAVPVTQDKIMRAHMVSPVLEKGKAYLPTGDKLMEEVINECALFPFAPNDDITDSVTQAFNFFRLKMLGRENIQTSNAPATTPIIERTSRREKIHLQG